VRRECEDFSTRHSEVFVRIVEYSKERMSSACLDTPGTPMRSLLCASRKDQTGIVLEHLIGIGLFARTYALFEKAALHRVARKRKR
jgi:hypothetical protein